MGPAIFIMAILGCGEADTSCQQVSVAQARYESVAACNADTASAVERNADLPYPVVVAQCQRADRPASQLLKPAQVDLPEPQEAQPRVIRASYQPARRPL